MKQLRRKLARKYLCIIFVLLIIFVGGLTFYWDVTGNALDMAVDNFTGDASIFTTYMNDMLQDKMTRLENIANVIDESVQYDTNKTKEILEENQREFDGLLILNLEGKRQLGDEILFNLIEDDMLDSMVSGHRSQIYRELVKDAEMNRYMVICTPIQYQGRVVAILAGAIRIEKITELVEKWSDSQDGCAFILSTTGDYVTEGKEFEEMIGGEANNFFTYLSNCKMSEGSLSRGEVESQMQKEREVPLRYTYNRDGYIGILQPCPYGNWYLGYVKMEKVIFQHAFSLERSTVITLMVSVALWILLMIFFGISIYRNAKYRENQERQELLDDLEKSITFEFNFFPKELRFYGDGKSMFGQKLHRLYGEEVYDVYKAVHPDDASVRGRIHQFYDNDESVFRAEVRIKNANGYGWYRIIGKLVKDKRYGLNQKFVGKVENADQEIAEEKNLVERAENDLLTGVLNKKTMEEKVIQCLGKVKGSTHCIFFMVDLDNFKNVNDQLGHISGDKAIVDTADRLREIFPKNAHVGRLGGDEFAVCAMYDAFDEESLLKYIKKRAEKICEVNRRTYSNGEVEVNISSSVGIAYAPNHATQFEELYKKADSALYRSKNGGKNCYHIY